MPNYATPGHPFSAQSIYVTVSPVYKKKGDGSQSTETGSETNVVRTVFNTTVEPQRQEPQPYEPKESFSRRLPNISRPQTGTYECGLVKASRSPRAQTAPPAYKYPPHVDHKHRLITANFMQHTPWCRDMYRWFTPDRSQGVWYNQEDFDRYRQRAFRARLPAQNIYHINSGLMPNYSGYVPGQRFRYGKTWTPETKNAKMIGIARQWESTSYFQDRPIGA